MAVEARTMELALQPLASVRPPRDLPVIRDIAELPPYIAEVVMAVAEGVETSREFARLRGVSISNAS